MYMIHMQQGTDTELNSAIGNALDFNFEFERLRVQATLAVKMLI